MLRSGRLRIESLLNCPPHEIAFNVVQDMRLEPSPDLSIRRMSFPRIEPPISSLALLVRCVDSACAEMFRAPGRAPTTVDIRRQYVTPDRRPTPFEIPILMRGSLDESRGPRINYSLVCELH
jgi:hypothetical protein